VDLKELKAKVHTLCAEIERLPASTQQTKVSLLASELLQYSNGSTGIYMIEGTWSGYRANQSHVVHREYSTDVNLIAQVRSIGHAIYYTDGTYLELKIKENVFKTEPVINGYTELIRQCIREKTNQVAKLAKV